MSIDSKSCILRQALIAIVWSVLIAQWLPSFLQGQIQTGRILGTVYDPVRATVPNATVIVTNTNTGVSQRANTNHLGAYVVPSLNPGIYKVSVAANGFRTSMRSGVEMLVGADLMLSFDLELGDTATVIQVTSTAPLLNSESGTVGHVMTNSQITDLPLNGRGFSDLARLTPGVVALGSTGNTNRIRPEFFGGTTISGVRGRQVSYYLDGSDTSEQHGGGTWIQTSIDALQEFSVQQNAYSAEHSRSGSFFNATTKSGTNSLRGTLFEFLRNDQLDARNFFGSRRDILKRNQFGASLGGPLRIPRIYNGANRTFWFFNYEGMRERQGNLIARTSPTAAMLDGDFGALSNRIYDPLTTASNSAGAGTVRALFPDNTIPSSRLSPQARFYDQFLTTATTPSGVYRFSPSTAIDEDQFTGRVDHSINDGNRLFVRWSGNFNRLSEPGGAPALGAAASRTRGQNYAISLSSNMRPTILNELRVNMLYGWINIAPFLIGRDFNKDAGVTGMEQTKRSYDIGSFPDFSWSGYTGLTGSAFDQRPKTQDRYVREILDNVTWIKGKQMIKVGGKLRYYSWLGRDSKNYMGTWVFSGQNTENPASPTRTGDAFADWALGLPASGGRGYPSDTFGGDYNSWHVFVQDDYKPTERLTLNIGLRYEFTPWASPYRGQTGTFDGTQSRPLILASHTDQVDLEAQPAARTAYGYLKDLIQTSHQAGLPYTVSFNDTRQWAPRVGFAWRPFGYATVVRGGYGIFYEGESTSDRVNLFMPPFLLSDSALNDRGVVPSRTLANFYLGAPLGSPNSVISLTPAYTQMKMGYDQHWSFGVQQQVAKSFLVDLAYVGNRGVHLNAREDFNVPEAGPGAVQSRRPYPRFSGFAYISSSASSSYHAVQGKLEKRLSGGIWFLNSYTISKSLWRQQTSTAGGRYAFENGSADFHVPHSLSNSFGYKLPFGRGGLVGGNVHPFVNGLIGGWQLQGILIFRSGLCFTPTVSRDVANTGVSNQRPNRLAFGRSDHPTLDRWFDVSAFAVAPNYTYGNSGLRILAPDIVRVVDFSLFKQFRIAEKANLQFRFEAFNLPNTASFAAPASTIDTAAAGRVTATTTSPRQMQFALKLSY